MDLFLTVKTADKYLQFGPDKCKVMLVWHTRKKHDFLHTSLDVDTWVTSYDNEGNIIDTLVEKNKMEEVKDILYLDVKISDD